MAEVFKKFYKSKAGDVKELPCDNGANFVGSERELKKSLQEWNQGQIERES